MAALTFKVGGDTSMLGGAMRKAKGMLGGLAGMAKKLALGGLAIGAAGAAAGMVALGLAARGVKKALDLGGALSDLSSRTGIAVGELVVLQQAFEDAGVSGDKVGITLDRLTRRTQIATQGNNSYAKAMKTLGLNAEELATQSKDERFWNVANAINAMGDSSEATAAAMDLLDTSAGELNALFSDPAALKKAQEAVGGQADILERNAASFDRSSDLLKSMGKKLQGLWVGMADFINPVLLPLLEKMNKLDLAKYGQAAGRFIATIAEAFKEGKLTGLLKDGLIVAGKEFVNVLVKGVKGVLSFLGAALPPVVESAWSKINDPLFWKGVMALFESAGAAMAAMIAKAAGNDEAAGIFADAAGSAGRAGVDYLNISGDGQRVTDVIGDALKGGAAAFADEMGEDGPLGTESERERMRKSWGDLAKAVDDRRAAEDAAAADEKAKGPVVPGDEIGTGGRRGGMRPIVSSLAKVGGAALIGVVRDGLDKERNRLLKSIDKNTRRGGVAVFA